MNIEKFSFAVRSCLIGITNNTTTRITDTKIMWSNIPTTCFLDISASFNHEDRNESWIVKTPPGSSPEPVDKMAYFVDKSPVARISISSASTGFSVLYCQKFTVHRYLKNCRKQGCCFLSVKPMLQTVLRTRCEGARSYTTLWLIVKLSLMIRIIIFQL